MARAVDWDNVGTRLRFRPWSPQRGNPDWNWVKKRWKTEADYWADDLSVEERVALVDCSNCGAPAGRPCTVLADICTPRTYAAGEEQLRRKGPRFGGPPAMEEANA